MILIATILLFDITVSWVLRDKEDSGISFCKSCQIAMINIINMNPVVK